MFESLPLDLLILSTIIYVYTILTSLAYALYVTTIRDVEK